MLTSHFSKVGEVLGVQCDLDLDLDLISFGGEITGGLQYLCNSCFISE